MVDFVESMVYQIRKYIKFLNWNAYCLVLILSSGTFGLTIQDPFDSKSTVAEIVKKADSPSKVENCLIDEKENLREIGRYIRSPVRSKRNLDNIFINSEYVENSTFSAKNKNKDELIYTSTYGSEKNADNYMMMKLNNFDEGESEEPIPTIMYEINDEPTRDKSSNESVIVKNIINSSTLVFNNDHDYNNNNHNTRSQNLPTTISLKNLPENEIYYEHSVPTVATEDCYDEAHLFDTTEFATEENIVENDNKMILLETNRNLFDEFKKESDLKHNSRNSNPWKRICFQNIEEIPYFLDKNILKLSENSAEMYIFYYIPKSNDFDESNIVSLSHSNAYDYRNEYSKQRFTQGNNSDSNKYSAYSLHQHKLMFPYDGYRKHFQKRSPDTYFHSKEDYNGTNSSQLKFSRSSKKSKNLPYFYCTFIPFYENLISGSSKSINGDEARSLHNIDSLKLNFNGPNSKSDEIVKTADSNNKKSSSVSEEIFLHKFLDTALNGVQKQLRKCEYDQRMCADKTKCVNKKSWCDTIVDCSDLSDELNCRCKERIHKDKVCDGYFDCPDGEDEKGCFDCPENSFCCNDWNIGQLNATCVLMSQRCDNRYDCPNKKDEEDCEFLAETVDSNNSFQTPYTTGYLHRIWKGKSYPACIDINEDNNWGINACSTELGIRVKSVESEIMPFYKKYEGKFISYDIKGNIQFLDFCGDVGYATFVKCPSIPCGSRIYQDDFYFKYRAKRQTEKEFDVNKNLISLLEYIYMKTNSIHKNLTRSQRFDEKIVGGEYSYPGRWPWSVAIYRNGRFHCGGIILDEWWILSAAHCFRNYEHNYYQIQAGTLRRFSFTPSEQMKTVTHIITHAAFSPTTMKNDLAVLKLEEPLKFNRWVRPTCLPEAKFPLSPPPGVICTAVGWGASVEHGRDPDNMKEVDVPILPKCKYLADREGDEICAGYLNGGRDTCQGDSGGPLLCRIPKTTDRWYVGGIVSHGEGCARPLEPGAYVRIALYLPWLLRNTDEKILTSTRKTNHECPGITCVHNGRCIEKKHICDRVIDCLHGEDEIDCIPYLLSDKNAEVDAVKYFPSLNVYKSMDPKNIYSETNGIVSSIELNPQNEIKFPILHSVPKSLDNLEKKESSYAYLQNSSTSENFICNILHQVIAITMFCDGEIDCEDGTDEINCTCVDLLKSHNSSLICDGTIHCHDSSDEINCSDSNCKSDEFFCYKSRSCINQKLNCDGIPHCRQGEDESKCISILPLVNREIKSEYDIFHEPIFSREGFLAYNNKGFWNLLCMNNVHNIDDRKIISTYVKNLGFMAYKNYRRTRVFQGMPFLTTEYPSSCIVLKAQFTLAHVNDEIVIPWQANIYINGELRCFGLLFQDSWIIFDNDRCSNYSLETDYMVATFGANAETNHIIRSYKEQIIPISTIVAIDKSLFMGKLKNDIVISERTKKLNLLLPPLFPSKKMEDSCILIVMHKGLNAKSYKLNLNEKCEPNKKCYTINNKKSLCSNVHHAVSLEAVVCLSEGHEWYLTRIINLNKTTFCTTNKTVLMLNASYDLLQDFGPSHLRPVSSNECNGYRCTLGKCIPWSMVCDGKPDCRENEDETKSACNKKINICQNNSTECSCKIHELKCKNGRCVSKSSMCDGKNDCGDNTDEAENCSNFTCSDYLKIKNPEKLCDSVQDCFDKSDENITTCPSLCNFTTSFFCNRSKTCVPLDFVCDGERDCIYKEDEEYCTDLQYTTTNRTSGIILIRANGEWQRECLTPEFIALDADKLCKQFGFNKIINVKAISGNKRLTTPFISFKLNEKMTIQIKNKSREKMNPMETCNYLHLSCK